jgi:accessory Sec system glycosyltransferase GtfB
MSTPFFVSNQLTEIPGSLYFQEVIGTEIPGNMLSILSGKTPTSRILFENAKEQAKVDQMATEKQVTLDYLGAIENFKREISFRPKLLTITRSDQILYDEAISQLTDYQWTIAAPSEVSEKLRNFANQHDNVHVLEAIPLSDIDKLLDEHDIYLDLNKGNDVDNVVRRAYLEGLLVIGDKSVVKNPGYELILENEKEITDVLKRPDKEVALRVLREKRGKPATVADYQRLLR